MRRISTLIAFAFFLLVAAPEPATACSCAWGGPFLKVAPGKETIVRGSVVAYHARSRGIDLSMDIDVLEVMKGMVTAKRIRIWGDNGAQCRPYVNSFPIGTEWVLAIDRITDGSARGDYFISVCGEHWAKVEGDTVIGRLTTPTPPNVSDVPERTTLDELRKRLSAIPLKGPHREVGPMSRQNCASFSTVIR